MIKFVMGFNPLNSIMSSIKIQAKPLTLTIIQVYAPTVQSDE